jgi:RNA polymerase sigma factor (sigma-70 family)
VASGRGGKELKKKRRSYRPAVEALEALRLLSGAAQLLSHPAIERDLLTSTAPAALEFPSATGAAWDTALDQTRLAHFLGPAPSAADARALESGLAQLNRYLSRAWFRAGIPAQLHDDSSQAVYVTLLQNLGSARFHHLVGEIGRSGIRDVLSRETPEGPDFFRAVDAAKKRAQREKSFQPLDKIDVVASPGGDDARAHWRGALREAIDQSLSPREAALIYATLDGETPAEIASQWGVAPKTVSNEKTRAIQKLRLALTVDTWD